MGPVELLRGLFPRLPAGYEVELRRVPGLGYGLDADFTMPSDLARSTYYFSMAPRRRSDRAVDLGNLVWVDTDGAPLELLAVYPPLTAAVFSGSITDGNRHYHLYWRVRTYVDVAICVRLSVLATVAYTGDYAVCEPMRVMRIPGSFNEKKKSLRMCELDLLDPSVDYEVADLEERLVAACFVPHFTPGTRHELALNVAALLSRAGWEVDRALRVVERMYEARPGTDLQGKLVGVRTTYQRKEAGEPVVSRLCKEALGPKAYRKLLEGLGIFTRDEDIIIDAEKVGTKEHLERDLANHIIASGNWGSADGRLVYWNENCWQPVESEVLKTVCFQTLARATIVVAGEELPMVARASKASAIASVVTGELLKRPNPDPDPLELPLLNGVLNVETQELGPHRREGWHRWVVPMSYDPTAQSPVWTSFVASAAPQPGLTAFLQEWVGYCLMSGNPWQRMLWLYGPSGTGKSTFIKVVNGLLGPSSVAVSTEKFTEYSIAQLSGMRVGMASELSPRTLRTSTLKALIAGDPTQARHPYGRPFDMTFNGKLIWSSNGMPPLDQAEGMRRRVNVVEFRQVPREVDVYLDKKLEVELPGVLNWALEGLARLLELRRTRSSDWKLPPSVQAFIDEFMESADPLTQFFVEEVEVGGTGPEWEAPAIEFYQRYVQWAKTRQVYIEQWGPAFYRAMRSHGLEPYDEEGESVGKRAVKKWHGGRLRHGSIGHGYD